MKISDFCAQWMAGQVVRLHTAPAFEKQNVGCHSWAVLLIYMRIFPEFNTMEGVRWIVSHDIPELWAGDIPAHTKWFSMAMRDGIDEVELEAIRKYNIDFPDLEPLDFFICKLCDALEFFVYSRHQMNLGNVYAHDWHRRIKNAILSRLGEFNSKYPQYRENSSEIQKIVLAFMTGVDSNLHIFPSGLE